MDEVMSDYLCAYGTGRSILLVGPYPPPLGGVSVHVQRLAELLKKNNYDVRVFNTAAQGNLLVRLISFWVYLKNREIVHFHCWDQKLLKLFLVSRKVRRIRLVITDHNPRLFTAPERAHSFFRMLLNTQIDALVAVSSQVLAQYESHGVHRKAITIVQPAFLSPPLEQESAIRKTYHPDDIRFAETHRPLLLSNAFRIVFHEGVDLYGLDMAIELTKSIKKVYPHIGLLFFLAEIGDVAYFDTIQERIKTLGLADCVRFVTGQKEFWPILRSADCLIRLTTTDGDAVSIREALLFGCPVLASDVCERPQGTVIFKNRDLPECLEKLLGVLAEKTGSTSGKSAFVSA